MDEAKTWRAKTDSFPAWYLFLCMSTCLSTLVCKQSMDVYRQSMDEQFHPMTLFQPFFHFFISGGLSAQVNGRSSTSAGRRPSMARTSCTLAKMKGGEARLSLG